MLTLVTAPAETPVSLAEARSHCRADTADDTLLQIYLDAAVAHVDGAEGVLGRCLVTQTWDYSLDCFPQEIVVPLPTLVSVTSLKYYDVDGVEQTISPSNYIVSGQRIVPVEDYDWPGVQAERPNSITVRFVAGYGTASDVPAQAKALILLLTEDFYRRRGATDVEAFLENPAIARIIRSLKKWRV